jgi:hypothetical protein
MSCTLQHMYSIPQAFVLEAQTDSEREQPPQRSLQDFGPIAGLQQHILASISAHCLSLERSQYIGWSISPSRRINSGLISCPSRENCRLAGAPHGVHWSGVYEH